MINVLLGYVYLHQFVMAFGNKMQTDSPKCCGRHVLPVYI